MAGRVEQLSVWMINKAVSLSWSIAQCKAVTKQQVYAELPSQYKEHLTQVVFLKAKRILVISMYRAKITELKDNATVRQEILAVFPDAEFSIDTGRKQIIIHLEGIV